MSEYTKLKRIYDEIDTLIEACVTSSTPEFIAWHTRADRFIRNYYGDGPEFKDFSNEVYGLMVWTSSTGHWDEVQACREGLISTKAKFGVYLEELEDEENSNRKESVEVKNKEFSKVFIVHGHNGELKQEVARVLEKQGIEAIILSEQANKGATIIEKFEKNSDVGAAICLFTEDDCGKAKEDNELKSRARQNVVFEAGYFIGKLGRQNVVIITNDKVELPGDLAGVVYTNNKMWEVEVLKELKEIGFSVDMNKLL